ncbi:MAG: hypothetical protein ACLFM0_00405 [Spirochaetales bacterium]
MRNTVLFLAALLLAAGAAFADDNGEVITVEGEGYEGAEMEVEVTFDDDELVDVEVVDHDANELLVERPFEEIPEQMVEEQTYDVDVVETQPETSEALIDLVAEAFEEAGL